MDDHRASTIVKIGDAKTRLSELIARVEKGEEIIIARDDKPVARLVQVRRPQAEIDAAIAAIREMRKRAKPVTTEEIIAWKNEGRRL